MEIVYQKPAHFLSVQMALLSTFFQMFMVHGMYNFGCRRYPTEEIEKFTLHLDVSEKGPLLETVALSYSVKWPLNIVLHSKALEMYNKVFQFLLSVKHSIWALIQIDVKALADTISEQGRFMVSRNKCHKMSYQHLTPY